MEHTFIKGIELAESFYHEAVRPILQSDFPNLEYSAARINNGSDVLGYDTPRSMDHGWGPSVEIYLRGDDYEAHAGAIDRMLSEKLPLEFRGFPTNYDATNDWVLTRVDSHPIRHGVKCFNAKKFITSHRVFNPVEEITVLDWLTIPQQDLRMLRHGEVFHDGLGVLDAVRRTLDYYPKDIWLYILSAQWHRIADEEPFMGRCGEAGDELGSRVIAARLVRNLMFLGFLMEKQYIPYSKWFGTAFSELRCAEILLPVFDRITSTSGWEEREKHLTEAYEIIAGMHNDLGITKPLEAKVSPFHNRPYLIIHGEDFAKAIYDQITDEDVLRLPKKVGCIDQITNVTGILDYPSERAKLVSMYKSTQHGIRDRPQ